jgi:electron transfer flavoprotein alpha subunit
MSAQDILVLGETKQGAPSDITLELAACARQLAAQTGGQAVVVLLGPEGKQAAAHVVGADRVLVIDDDALASYMPEPYVAVLSHLLESGKPRALLAGSTSVGLDVAPLLAARLNVPIIGGCQKIEAADGTLKVTASFCAGKMLADLEVSAAPAVLVVLPGSYRAAAEGAAPQVETIRSPVPLEPGPVRFEQMILPAVADVDITQQDVLVAVGRGIQQQENLALAEELAEVLGGAVCASRPIVDQGWLPLTRQVGKSGMTVKPKLYLALGISGAPEHLEGIKGANLIIAVNTDPKAPIFDVAQYGVQQDLLDFAPALIETLRASKSEAV